jgi:hypothetical protein
MANFTRNFTAGRMNKTYDERVVPDGEYIDAMNIRMGSTENSEIGVIENTKGNTALTDLMYVNTGEYISTEAVCIGAFSDTANDTLYWFVHDPMAFSGATGKLDLIVSFNVSTNILTYHITSIGDGGGVYTTLNFNPSYLVNSVDKIGDLLFFTDNYNPPRFIDVTKNYLLPTISDIDYNGNPALLREAILVIKQPPIESPTVQLITQGDQNNYLEERFICFAYRYKYANGEYSATSQWSAPAFFPNEFSFSPNTYLNEGMTNAYNAAIVTYATGGPLVVGIDLLFKQANNNIIKVIEKLDKALLGIPDNTTQTFTFNSSKIFTVLSEGEILRLYDNVPRLAKAQTIMGNRLMYGNYIEGYDLIDKFGSPTRLEYETELVTEEIGFDALTTETWDGGPYNIDGGGSYITNSALRINLSGVSLTAGSSITIDITFEGIAIGGISTFSPTQAPTSITFSFILAIDYPSVYAMVTSPEFQNAVGTTFNILPVYSPIPGVDTSCNGATFTDSLNCSIQDNIVNDTTLVAYFKFRSGITTINEPIAILEASPANDYFSLQLVAMEYVDSATPPIDSAYAFFRIIEHSAYFQKVASPRSLHSNRDYEIGIVYMDEFNRSTTALVSPYNTEHVPCRFSINKNSIRVNIPTSQRAPAWAKRYKFVCKADAENYETIYSNIFFTAAGTSDVYFLLEGENMRKVETGDRYIVKRDTNGPLLGCVYATVLEKEAQQAGFITTSSGVTPPAGVYMKISPDNFQADQSTNSVINPGQITTNENNGGDYPLQEYPMNILVGGSWVDYTVPAGSVIQMKFKFQRLGPGDGNNSCERRIYTNNVTLVSSGNYANMYDWWIGDNVASVLNNGTSEVGGSGNCPISNTFYPSFGMPTGDVCNNKYQFFRYGNNQLVLRITGTQRCPGATGADKRRSSIITKITVFRADAVMVFETLPKDTLPDIFFENDLSFPIDVNGNHLSNGAVGDVSQDIASGIPGEIQTGFFNCFAFGNAVESYKIRDSIVGRSFNLGERVTTVAAQDYQEARRFADITYSGVYNQETNVNKLNEFNIGLLNFKNLETSFGDIQVLDGRETDVLTLQEDKISYVLAGKNLLSDAAAGGAITSVPEVLGTQIARVEKYGISFNPESYVQWGYDRFFTDIKRGAVIQLKGNSMSQDQLAVISEANMRTWFRDEFINSFNTQKLGGYDPYMNEYVLSTNDRELPGNPQCLACGVSQTFSASFPEGIKGKVAEYCVDLGSAIGEVTVSWTILSLNPGSTFYIGTTYDGTSYGPGYINYDGSYSFNKDSILETSALMNINVIGGPIVLSVFVSCPVSTEVTVIEVVVTSDQDSSETIHTQYRYIDGAYIGPLQTNSVLFQSGTNPVVSRYNSVTGPAGSGSIPTEGSTLVFGTNKIVPDTYDFDPFGNKLRYLRSTTLYNNNPTEITALLNDSINATPITGGPTQYQSSFIVPPNIDGNYLYLVWDLRTSGVSNLCFAEKAEVEMDGLKPLCCDCAPCSENCIAINITNNSRTEEANIYFPSGLCGESKPVTITLASGEISGTLCINNDVYYVTSGDVNVNFEECGCTVCLQTCQEYVVWTGPNSDQFSYTNCSGQLIENVDIDPDFSKKICVQIGTTVEISKGNATADLSNACGCCLSYSCLTWQVVNNSAGTVEINYTDCSGTLQTMPAYGQSTVTFCGLAGKVPTLTGPKASLTAIGSCSCTNSTCTSGCQEYTVYKASPASPPDPTVINYIDCETGDALTYSDDYGIAEKFCVPKGEAPTVGQGSVNSISLTNECGCCSDSTCWTWSVVNNIAYPINFVTLDCLRGTIVITSPANSTISFCALAGKLPADDSGLLIFDVIDTCNCNIV